MKVGLSLIFWIGESIFRSSEKFLAENVEFPVSFKCYFSSTL